MACSYLAPLVLAIVAIVAIADEAKDKVKFPGCNADVCFALYGRAKTYGSQQNIVGGATHFLRNGGGENSFSAVQYTSASIGDAGISKRTEDGEEFSNSLYGSSPNAGIASPINGINYCFSQLMRRGVIGNGRRKIIVLLGPGTNEFGQDPVDRAELFARAGGKVFSVGVGDNVKFQDLKDVSLSWWRTLALKDFKTPWGTGLELGKRICETKL